MFTLDQLVPRVGVGRYRGVLVLAALMLFGTYAWFMSEDFCFSKMLYLGDRELIVSAIRWNAQPMKLDGTEASADAYLAANPGCCRVIRRPASRSLLDVLTGFNIAEVSLTFPNPYPGQAGLAPLYQSYIAVEACGTTLAKDSGTGLERTR